MLQWIKDILFEKPMSAERRRFAVMCTESIAGQEVFKLDNEATTRLVKEGGVPARMFDGTRHDN